MAKKKENDAGGVIIIIVIVLLIILALATPIVLMFGYIYNKMKADGINKRLSGTMSDFWLDQNEKNEFKEKLSQLSQVNNIIEKANEEGINAGISRNKDGSFSARSTLGKEIKATIKQYDPIKKSLSNDLYNLQNLPLSKWEEFNDYIKNAKAFFWSFIFWSVTLLYYFIALGKHSISEIFIPYLALATNFFRDSTNKLPIGNGDIQMIAVATIIAIAIYFILRTTFKNMGSKYSPRPEKVSLENIDSY